MKFFRFPAIFTVFMILAALAGGCATSGPKYIDLAYTGQPEKNRSGTLGISRFSDMRPDQTRGGIGYRVLNDKSREVFLVQGLDLAGTLTDLTQVYLEKKGFAVMTVPAWSPTLEGLAQAGSDKDRLLTANINRFDCRAVKKGAITEMTLEIDLTIFLAAPGKGSLTTIPVALALERTDVNFTRKKVESFFNDTLAEVLEKALPLESQQ